MEEGGLALVRDGVPLLGFGLVFVLIFRKLGLGATLGYLIAGAVVGPQVLGLVHGGEAKLSVAEIGIAFLLFLVGLELSPTRLWAMKRDIFGFGLLQVISCGLALSGVIWLFTRASNPPASIEAVFALGLPLALSSTAQVLPMLQSAGRLRTPLGERAFSILLFQDLSIVPLITIVAAMSRRPLPPDHPSGWVVAGLTVGAVIALVIVGRFGLRPLFRLIGNLGEREMFVFAGLFTVIASAAVMEWIGASPALGAFVAGVMLADSPYRHELEADVEPFRSILLGLFFLAVGMTLDLHAIAERPFFVIGIAISLIVVKTILIGALALLFGMRWRQALALGLLLSQGGEFGFVLVAEARDGALVLPEAASLFGAVVTLSMATTPFLMALTKRMRSEPPRSGANLARPRRDGSDAIVVGYGRFGQTVAQMLIAQGISVSLVDTDVEMIETADSYGMKVYYGDGMRLDLLRQAGADEAELILFCQDGDNMDTTMLEGVHRAFPAATIFVRAFDRRSILKMRGAPIAGAVREMLESAIQMARLAMEAVGVDGAEIDKTEAEYRHRDGERLALQKETGDMYAAHERVFTHAAVAAQAAAKDGD
jgi:CPA2 family monovalent cation:H+ antiporter-2/glutathione-regulated potassium-efflux system protein KefB